MSSGILGEIAAAKSLAETLYNFVSRLKSAGLDIGDLDLRLQNDRLLLSRHYDALSQMVFFLQDCEILHLRDYFRIVIRTLLDCAKTMERYKNNGRMTKLVWCVFKNEIEEKEKKVAEWINELTSWVVVLNADRRGQNYSVFRPQPTGYQNQPTENLHISKSAHNNGLDEAQLASLLCYGENASALSPRLTFREHHSDTNGTDTHDINMSTNPVANLRIKSKRLINSGGFGQVYSCEGVSQYYGRTRDPHIFTLKVIRSDEDFKDEIAALQELKQSQHKHIVKLLHAYEGNNNGQLLFPLGQGDLRSLFRNVSPIFDITTEQWLMTQMAGISSALDTVHGHGICHGDMKPENILIMLDENNENSRWVLGDFGLAKFIDRNGNIILESKSGRIEIAAVKSLYAGTKTYCEPLSNEKYRTGSFTSDIWALGCILFEALAWYFKPPGYNPQNFLQSRIQTIREDGSIIEEDERHTTFWKSNNTGEVFLCPSVKQHLRDIKTLAMRSRWLLDVPYHVEKLLDISAETRPKASEVASILQHNMMLKNMALGGTNAPYTISNGQSFHATARSSADSHPLQNATFQNATFQNDKACPTHPAPEATASVQTKISQKPELRRGGKWSPEAIRSRYLED